MLAARKILTVSVLALLASATAQAQQAPASPPAIDPTAIAALSRMGEFLRKHNSMEIRAETRTDELLESGQKVQITAQMDLKVRRPDRLRLLKASDRKTREFFYDGKTFTIYGVRSGYYARFLRRPPSSNWSR
jgi:hypothetical protein